MIPMQSRNDPKAQQYLSISELAARWRCSRGTVYNRLRLLGLNVLDFAPPGKRGKKIVSLSTIVKVEESTTKRLR
jgi:hypothetical protein